MTANCTATVRVWGCGMPSDALLRIALYSALAVAVLTLLLLVYALLITSFSQRRNRTQQQFEATWRPYLAGVAVGDEVLQVPSLPVSQRNWFLLLWCRTQRSLRGSARPRLNAMFSYLELEPVAVTAIQTGSVREQLTGLTALGYLDNLAHWELVAGRIEAANPIIALAAAKTLVSLDSERALRLLMPLFLTRADWSMVQLKMLCRLAGPLAVTAPLLSELRHYKQHPATMTPHAVSRMLRLMAFADQAQLASPARDLLISGDATAAYWALLCLGENADPRDRDRILAHLHHAAPEVRAMAAQALQATVNSDDLMVLLPLLEDQDWWVRQQAADAVVKIPGMNRQQLQTLMAEMTDPYGREALAYALTGSPV